MSAMSNVVQLFPGTTVQERNANQRLVAIDSEISEERRWIDRVRTQRPGTAAVKLIAINEADARINALIDERDDIAEVMRSFIRLLEPADLDQPPAVEEPSEAPEKWAVSLGELLDKPTEVRWLLPDIIEQGVLALLVGPRGSYKSFLAIGWAMRAAVAGHPVFVISAEGGDFDRRVAAWLKVNAPTADPRKLPIRVAQKRVNLNSNEAMRHLRDECADFKPRLFVFDTFAKLSGGLDEDSNTDVKQFIGRLDNGLKRHFDATVLVVAHTGHSEQGRARGASALGADTDAEYIVSNREGLVTVTRQRFKSSPELPDLQFRAAVVDLGRVDTNKAPVTSVVLEPAEVTPRAEQDLQASQRPALDAVRRLECDLGCPPTYDAAFEAIAGLGVGGKTHEAHRVRNARRTVKALQDRGLLHRVDAEHVSTSRAVRAESESFE